MNRPLTKKQGLAVIQAVADLNARLIGEEPKLVVRVKSKGWIRVDYIKGERHKYAPEPREYAGVDAAIAAAWTALARARAYHDGREDWETAEAVS